MECCFQSVFFSSLFSEGKPDPSGWTSPRFFMFRPDHNGWNPLMVAAHQGTKEPWPELLSALKIQLIPWTPGSSLTCCVVSLGRVYMTPGRLSPQSKFTRVPSHGSLFVYMIPPQNVMPAHVTLVWVHPGSCTGAKISLQYETLQWYHVNMKRDCSSLLR